MPIVEAYADKDALEPLFIANFDFLPRIGETISRDTEGYFDYYTVVEIWHRLMGDAGAARACIRLEIDD